MRTVEQTFGVSGPDLAASAQTDSNSMPSPVATTRAQNQPPSNPLKALLDPSGSAIFWLALAAVLGLILVSGDIHLDAKLGGRAGRR